MAVSNTTSTSSGSIAQILLLAVGLVLALLASLIVAPNIVIMNVRPDLFLLCLALIITRQSKLALVICAFVCGLMADFVSTGAFGIYTISYSIAGFSTSQLLPTDSNQGIKPVSKLQKYAKLLCLVGVAYASLALLGWLTDGLDLFVALVLETYLPAALFTYCLCAFCYLVSDLVNFLRGRTKTNSDMVNIGGKAKSLSVRKLPKRGKTKWIQ